MSVLVVTGTGTEVGKTVVTAALAALALLRGVSVAVVKPAQTGVAVGEPGDLDEVRRLVGDPPGLALHEGARFPAALSPAAASRVGGRPPVDLDAVARRVADLAARHRLVLVEGAGGLLVRYDPDGATIAALAAELAAPVLVVTRAGLGTLSDTALTLEAVAARGLDLSGVVIGAWPRWPGLAERSNVGDLETLAARPLAGALPAGLGPAGPVGFASAARAALAPAYGGAFDPADFRRSLTPTARGTG